MVVRNLKDLPQLIHHVSEYGRGENEDYDCYEKRYNVDSLVESGLQKAEFDTYKKNTISPQKSS